MLPASRRLLFRRRMTTDRFIGELMAVAPGTTRLLWLPRPADTTTTLSDGRTHTYRNSGGLIANGDFEIDTTGWSGLNSTAIARVTTDSRFGLACLRSITPNGAAVEGPMVNVPSLAAATAYTWSFYFKGEAGVSYTPAWDENDSGASYLRTALGTAVIGTGDWQRVTMTATSGASTASINVYLYPTVQAARTFYIDGVRFETGSTATAFAATGRTFTNSATIQGRISYQGKGILVSFNGTDQYVTTGDTDDLSFGNSTADSPFSIVSLANVTNTAAFRVLAAKYNFGASTPEWAFQVNDAADKLNLLLTDKSNGATASRLSDAAITQGSSHLFGSSYTGVGGASAANGITLYQDGAAIASTATTGASYVAMENLGASVSIGALADPLSLFSGSMGFTAVYAAALTAAQHKQIANIVSEYYSVRL